MSTSSALYIIPVLKCVGKTTINISITLSIRINSDSSSSNRILVSQAFSKSLLVLLKFYV
jgi:hypothetical protein